MKPFSPKEVYEKARENKKIPAEIIDAVNTLLIKNYKMNYPGLIVIKQNELLDLVLMNENYTREQIFAEGYLDFEAVFERAGWRVDYDKPGYNESYEAYWKFYT